MNGLAGIEGQDRALAQLRRALGRGAVHHAYLFEGPDGVGKRSAARAFAQACNCDVAPGEGCGVCEACRKIDGDLHPDVKWLPVSPEKGQTDRMRALLPQLAFPPHEGRRRVIVLEPADELNEAASNVLLKTLEEPPADTHFVLVTSRAASMLVTIRSRCQRVSFHPLDVEVVARRLVTAHGVAAETARDAAALAQGSLGRALFLATTEDLPRRQELARRLLEAARSRKLGRALEVAGELAGDRDEALAVLELLWITYRDALLLAGGLDAGGAAGPPGTSRRREAEWLAGGVATCGLLQGLAAITDTTESIEGYVGPQLALEALVLHLGQAQAA